MIRLSSVCAAALLLAACDSTPTQSLRPAEAARATAFETAGITFLADEGSASAINSAGDVAGASDGKAFLWRDGVLTSLGAFSGTQSVAWSLNAAGQVVGMSGQDAFLWEEGAGMISLGGGSAEAINDATSPLIAGGDTLPRVWEWDGSAWTTSALPVLDGTLFGWGFGVNLSGAVAGLVAVQPGSPGFRAVVWERHGGAWTIRPIGALPGATSSIANDINDAGQVSGWSGTSVTTAFLWENGVMRALPPLPGGTRSGAYRLNNLGHVAGSSDHPDRRRRAVVWVGGVPIDLGLPAGASFCGAVDINDRGQVVGDCTIDRVTRPVLWELGTTALSGLAPLVEELAESGEIANRGVASSLSSKLAEVQAAVDRGATRAAVNQLGAFAAQVRAQAGKHISESAAAALVAMADAAGAYLAP